jgi:hypothetical protein
MSWKIDDYLLDNRVKLFYIVSASPLNSLKKLKIVLKSGHLVSIKHKLNIKSNGSKPFNITSD